MFDLVELQRKLQEARNEKIHTPNSGIISKYRLRTASHRKGRNRIIGVRS